MGMYTELVLGVELSKDAPEDVINTLKYMVGDREIEPSESVINSHPLFSTDRWRYLLTCDSYYFDGKTHSEIEFDDISKSYYLTTRSNLKNYDSEIEFFLDWIKQYVETCGYWGYYRYEEDELPTIIYFDKYDDKINLLDVDNRKENIEELKIKTYIEGQVKYLSRNDEEKNKWNYWLEKYN